MKIKVYGDSYVFGTGLDWQYAVKKGYIDNYMNYKDLRDRQKSEIDEITNFLFENRWTSLLEKELGVQVENYGVGGTGWQFIEYIFLQNELKESNKDDLNIFCPPRNIRRLIIDDDYKNEKLNIMYYKGFNSLNISHNTNSNMPNELIFLDKIFTNNVCKQLNFQNVFGIISYLLLNKKNFLFLPSWLCSLEESFISTNESETSKIINLNRKKNILKILERKSIFFKNNMDKNEKDMEEIFNLYKTFIFKHIKNITFDIFWKNEDMFSPSGHPTVEGHELIKNEYLKYIKNFL